MERQQVIQAHQVAVKVMRPEIAHVLGSERFLREIETLLPAAKGLLELSGGPIPVACDLDDSELRALLPHLPDTPLHEGIAETLEMFARLQDAGNLDLSDLQTS